MKETHMYEFSFQKKYTSENFGKGIMVLARRLGRGLKSFFTANIFYDFTQYHFNWSAVF